MRAVAARLRRGFALPVTIVLTGVCALLIAVAYKAVDDGARVTRAMLAQTYCRLVAQSAMDVFVERLHASFNRATWEKSDGTDTVAFMNDVTAIYDRFFVRGAAASSGGDKSDMVSPLESEVDLFNAPGGPADALGRGGGWMALTGGETNQLTLTVRLLDPDMEKDVHVRTDEGGCYRYADVTLRMLVTAEFPRQVGSQKIGASSLVEQSVRFGALGFGTRAGCYDENVNALPMRCFESAVNADCPMLAATCAGNSGWTVNGEVRTRGFVWCGNENGATTRLQGELHVAALPTNAQETVKLVPDAWNGRCVNASNLTCYAVNRALLDECVNGANCYMRFPSPGRLLNAPVPAVGSPEWYEYTAVSNGAYRGGYAHWQEVEAAGCKPRVFERADASWFHIPVLALPKDKKTFNGSINVPNYSSSSIVRNILGIFPSGQAVSFTLPKDYDRKVGVKSNYSTREALYLLGTQRFPIVIDGAIYWNGDVVIGGFIKGHGSIWSGRNIHIVRDIIMSHPPTWRREVPYDATARRANGNADMIALLARGNIVVGNYRDVSRNEWDDVTGFREKIQRVTYAERTAATEPQLAGYTWRKYVELSAGSPLCEGNFGTDLRLTGTFDGDYFAWRNGRPILEPYNPADRGTTGNSVTNLCRPVVRIDAMLCSENAIVGIVGPGDFSWAKAKIETGGTGDEGYGALSGGGTGIRAGHGMQLTGAGSGSRAVDYLMKPFVAFTLNGGIVCRDLALYVDYDQFSGALPGSNEWTPGKLKAIVNWDPRYMADSEDAAIISRGFIHREWLGDRSDRKQPPAQNPIELPTDSSPKPQILSWREIADGILEVDWN